MTPAHRLPPAPEDLPELYLKLVERLDRLEGTVRQSMAEGTRDALERPTWRDVDALKKDIERIEQSFPSPPAKPSLSPGA